MSFAKEKLKALKAIAVALTAAVLLASCDSKLLHPQMVIGVLLPTTSSERWINDGDYLRNNLISKGYKVEVRFAEDNIDLQVQQLKEMLESNVHCLVIASIDSLALLDGLTQAYKRGIPVISYDRLLLNTQAVSYYVSFDNKNVGTQIAQYIETQYQLETAKDEGRSYTIEFFMGSPDDNNAIKLHDGIIEVLDKYLKSGVLVCESGETEFGKTCILRWSRDTAKKRCDNLLDIYYKDSKLDIACSAYDGFAYGIRDSLLAHGYKVGTNWPCVTGQDAEIKAVQNIIEGSQAMTIYKDSRELSAKCVTMVDALFHGMRPEINNKTDYNNGRMNVLSYLCRPVTIDAFNIEQILVQGGYYTKGQLGLE